MAPILTNIYLPFTGREILSGHFESRIITHNIVIINSTWTVACRLCWVSCCFYTVEPTVWLMRSSSLLMSKCPKRNECSYNLKIILLTVAQSVWLVLLANAMPTSSMPFIHFPHKVLTPSPSWWLHFPWFCSCNNLTRGWPASLLASQQCRR